MNFGNLPLELLERIAVLSGIKEYCTMILTVHDFGMRTIFPVYNQRIRKLFTVESIGPNSTQWTLHGKLHREDGPAFVWFDGSQEWYRHGKRHRENGPAVENAKGTKQWFRNGLLHREDGPAIAYADGSQVWYREGKLHREDGPAIAYADGTQEWYQKGKRIKRLN
jgi:hypothetical protein